MPRPGGWRWRLAGAVLVAAVLPGCANLSPLEGDRLYYASQGLLAYDLLCQTTQIRKRDDVEESNPLLSKNPSVGEVVTYWAASALVHHVVYKALKAKDERWARAWAGLYAGKQAYDVHNNEANHRLRCF